jgi:drug/metabolite transporter superfamily protein YnfA
MKKILYSLLFFFIAGLCEIGDGYLVWKWIRGKQLYFAKPTNITRIYSVSALRAIDDICQELIKFKG